MVNREINIAQWYIQSKPIMDPMSSYPGLPFYITVDNCSYQLIIRRASSLRMNLYTRFLIAALLSGTWYSTNMVDALQYIFGITFDLLNVYIPNTIKKLFKMRPP